MPRTLVVAGCPLSPVPCPLSPVPCPLSPVTRSCRLFPIPYSLFPIPYSLFPPSPGLRPAARRPVDGRDAPALRRADEHHQLGAGGVDGALAEGALGDAGA